MSRILVINPNSSDSVTATIDRAIEPLRLAGGPRIDCVSLASGPPAIETQADVDSVALPLAQRIAGEKAEVFVIACFSDPGLHAAREAVAQPVIGICESSVLHALGLGHSIGIISILDRSVRRHLRYVRSLGLASHLAGDRAIDLGVHDAADPEKALHRIITVGEQLRDKDGADVLILGCAGMAHHRHAIEERLQMPVVDPCQAAVARAIALTTLGYTWIRS